MSRFTRAGLLAVLVCGLIGMGGASAAAHPLSRFTVCAAYQASGGVCQNNSTYLYGDTVYLRGEIRPPHAWMRAQILRKQPNVPGFVRVGTADISPAGHVRWSWHTSIDDAHQNAPYLFKLRLKNHGVSNTIKVWVIFGE
jgi:hypothetical protein